MKQLIEFQNALNGLCENVWLLCWHWAMQMQKGKDINSEGWTFRMLYFSKGEKEVRSLDKISKNLFREFEIEIYLKMTNSKSQS